MLDTMKLALILLCLHFEYLADGSNICKTSRCISVADEISQLMDPLVDPCIDFNRFSCGGFERSQTLVGPNDIKQTVDITIRNLKQRIKKLLEMKKNRRNDFETNLLNLKNAVVRLKKLMIIHHLLYLKNEVANLKVAKLLMKLKK